MGNAGEILVVDDEQPLQSLLQDFLTGLGYDVRVAGDGEQALQLLRRQAFHGVLADLKMPKLGGLELLRAIKALKPALPVIIITGYPSVEVAVEVMREGAADFITKPLRLNHLELVLHNLTKGATSPPHPSLSPAGGEETGEGAAGQPNASIIPIDLPIGAGFVSNMGSSTDVWRFEFQGPDAHLKLAEPEAQFIAGIVPCRTGEPGWTALTKAPELVPFVAPAWDIPAPLPAEEPSGAPLREALQAQVQQLLQEAEQEAQRLKETAYATGFAEGEQQGLAAAQRHVEAVVAGLGQALRDVAKLRTEIFQQSERQLVELALAIARKVLHREGNVNRSGILPLVQAGIKMATQRRELCIRVHPTDVLFTMSCKAQLHSFLDGIETIAFEEDDTVPPGSCVVETPTEIVDLRWEEQLAEVAAGLFKVMSNE